MKNNQVHWGRGLVLGLTILAVGGGLMMFASSTTAAPSSTSLPAADETATCLHGAEETIEVAAAVFTSPFNGSITAKTGASFYGAGGLKTVPLSVLGFEGRAYVEGLGESRIWLDRSRPLTSTIRENVAGAEFPATQEMRLHFFLETDAMPGKTLRTMNPFVVRNPSLKAFPPPAGSRLRLTGVVNLEDVAEPGRVVAKLLDSKPTLGEGRLHARPQIRPQAE